MGDSNELPGDMVSWMLLRVHIQLQNQVCSSFFPHSPFQSGLAFDHVLNKTVEFGEVIGCEFAMVTVLYFVHAIVDTNPVVTTTMSNGSLDGQLLVWNSSNSTVR